MMGNKLALAAIALWLATAAALGVLFVRGNVAPATDGRTAILLNEQERTFVLGEMRKMLIAVQRVTEGIAEGDRAKAATAAREVSDHSASPPPIGLMAKMPMEFRQAGMAMHDGFGDLAKAAADEKQDAAALTTRLARQINACVGCHETFRIDLAR